MILTGIRELCILSVFCGAAMSLCPVGGAKQILGIGCAAVLTLCVLNTGSKLDLSAYGLELARYEERKEEFLKESAERADRLDRLVIEEQYKAYIMDKAREFGLTAVAVQVQTEWSMEGFWIPRSVQLRCSGEAQAREKLRQCLLADLGIPEERQAWE